MDKLTSFDNSEGLIRLPLFCLEGLYFITFLFSLFYQTVLQVRPACLWNILHEKGYHSFHIIVIKIPFCSGVLTFNIQVKTYIQLEISTWNSRQYKLPKRSAVLTVNGISDNQGYCIYFSHIQINRSYQRNSNGWKVLSNM